MNYEEAVERVLQGDPWSRCGHCKGSGKVGLPKVTEVFEKGDDLRSLSPLVAKQRDCPHCAGAGWRKRRTYEEACELLGRAYPDPPPKGFFIANNELVHIGRVNPRAIDLLKNVEGPGMSVINTNAVRALNIPQTRRDAEHDDRLRRQVMGIPMLPDSVLDGVKADQIIIDDPMKEP